MQSRRDNAIFKGSSGKGKEVVQAITRSESTRFRDRAAIQSTNAKIRYRYRYCIVTFFVRDTITHIICENLPPQYYELILKRQNLHLTLSSIYFSLHIIFLKLDNLYKMKATILLPFHFSYQISTESLETIFILLNFKT